MFNLLNKNERELVKLANFFIKNTERLIDEGKLEDEHRQVVNACTSLIEKVNLHAEQRESVHENRIKLKNAIQDHAQCPKCTLKTYLKLVGVDTEEQWKCNRYKCRKCNIEFTWNRPNNPWDMVPFIEALLVDLGQKMTLEGVPEAVKEHTLLSIEQMKENLIKIKSSIEVSDEEYNLMQEQELEMSKLVHEFKNYLMIEKIKMNAWTNPFSDN